MFPLTRSAFLLATAVIGLAAAPGYSQAVRSTSEVSSSRVDIYGGYAYLTPINSTINNYQYQLTLNPNVTLSISDFFRRNVGIQVEGSYFSGNNEHADYDQQNGLTCYHESCSQLIYTAEAGPVVRFPIHAFVPFVHALGGGVRMNGPVNQPLQWGWGGTVGGGLDYVLPYFNNHVALRLLQTDFQFSNVDNGPLVQPAGLSGGQGRLAAYKFSVGLVARIGEGAPRKEALQLGCAVAPVSGFPGDPLQINGTTLGTDPVHTQVFTWTSNGGKITGKGLNPALDTTGMAPGEYVVKGHIAQGPRPSQQADCTAPFTIRRYDPPTITCSATPNVALSGTTIAISTTGGSPQNRPLTYSYAASQGVIASSGPTATLATAGLSPAVINITCNVVDDQGQSAQANTTVTLNAPPAPVVPSTQPLCSLNFDRDKRRPVRVDNEAKACLDDIALTLNQQADAHLVIVGSYEGSEINTAGAQRAVNARLYLTQEKGIDPSRIELRVGESTGKTVTNTLVPAGAIFNEVGTHKFDERAVPHSGQPYGHPTAAAHPKQARKSSAAPVVKPGQAPVSNAPTAP